MSFKRLTTDGLMLGFVFLLSAAGCGPRQRIMFTDPRIARIDARDTLRQAADDKDKYTRSAAIEAMVDIYGDEAGAIYQEALNDPEPVVRFAATLAIGDLKYKPAEGKLLQMAQYKVEGAEVDKRVYCGVIYALWQLGHKEYGKDLGKLIYDEDAEIRATTAQVFGKIGQEQAIPILKDIYSTDHNVAVRLQVLVSLSMLGDNYSTKMLEAYAGKRGFLAQSLAAVEALGHFRSRRTVNLMQRILYSDDHPPRLRVMAAGILAKLGQNEDYGYELSLTSASEPKEVLEEALPDNYKLLREDIISLRVLAAKYLGWMPYDEAVDILHQLLESKNGTVRVASAMSILRLLDRVPQTRPENADSSKKTDAGSGKTFKGVWNPADTSEKKEVKLHKSGWKD